MGVWWHEACICIPLVYIKSCILWSDISLCYITEQEWSQSQLPWPAESWESLLGKPFFKGPFINYGMRWAVNCTGEVNKCWTLHIRKLVDYCYEGRDEQFLFVPIIWKQWLLPTEAAQCEFWHHNRRPYPGNLQSVLCPTTTE